MAKYRASISFKIKKDEKEEARIVMEFEEDMLGKILDAYEAISLSTDKDMDFYVHKV